MATISKTFRWEASHVLPGHKGKCARLHGHSYKCEVYLSGDIKPVHKVHKLPVDVNEGQLYSFRTNPDGTQEALEVITDGGMVVDFYDVGQVMKPIVEKYLDHYFLNESLNIPRTTAELIACWIYGACHSAGLPVANVAVYETKDSSAFVNYKDWVENGSLCPPKEEAKPLGPPSLTEVFESNSYIKGSKIEILPV